MGLIAIKEKGIDLPQNNSIVNCLKYAKDFSVSFARNNKITIVKNITDIKEYEKVINNYNLNKNDSILLTFNKYTDLNIGKMPIIIDNSDNEYKDDIIVTTNSVMATKEDVLGVKDEEVARKEFVKYLSMFNRLKHQEFTKLVFGDNLVAILNADGSFEKYGLENNSNKKWIKSESGILYNDDDFQNRTYYNYHNTCGYYHNSYSEYDDYYYDDYRNKQYTCEKCNKKTNSVFLFETNFICVECYNKNKGR